MSWVEGLLGAVMGGAQEYGTILKEEETAKRKEEEEKRKEERALSLREREREMERRRTEENERLKAEKMAKMLGPSTQMTPGANPMEPEGIVESQIPLERRLVTAREEALSKGDVAAAKDFNEQYKSLKQEERAQAEEARKQEEFGREPKPKEPTGEVATIQFLARQTYKGPVGEDGKPDPVAYAAHLSKVSESFIDKKTQLRPERVAGGPKPLSEKDRDVAQGRILKMAADLSIDQVGEQKVKNPAKEAAVNKILEGYMAEVTNADPEKDRDAFYRVDLTQVQGELTKRLKAAQDAAAAEAGRRFTEYRSAKKMPDESNEQFRARKEAILPSQFHKAADTKSITKENFVEFAKDDFLSITPTQGGFSMRRIR